MNIINYLMEETTMIEDITPKTVGARIKCLREKKGESQEILGKAIGLSQNSISKLEKGETQLTLENQYSLVKHFNVSHDYLISGKNENSLLVLLEKYISMNYSPIFEGDLTFYCPILKIDKILFNYLIRTARAKQDNYIPDDIKRTWIEREIDAFYESNEKNQFTEFESVIPIPQRLISPDKNKENWKQADLLREINKELLNCLNANNTR